MADGLVPKELAASPRDMSEQGLANVLAAQLQAEGFGYLGRQTDYKNSYIGVMDYGWPYDYFQKNILPAKNPGWLVNIVDTKVASGDDDITTALGPYQRLLLDGSVQNRIQAKFNFSDQGSEVLGIHPVLMFIDEGAKWVNEKGL